MVRVGVTGGVGDSHLITKNVPNLYGSTMVIQ